MLQDLLAGVTDRVVVAITFLAMLELVKGRELTVEQAEPWGPISVRRRDGLAAPDAPVPRGRWGRPSARMPTRTTMTSPDVEVAPADDAMAPVALAAASVRDLEALLFVAETPLSRREIGSLCGIDRDAVDTLLGDLEVVLRDRGIRLRRSANTSS